MFKVGNYVFHKISGVCVINNISPLSSDDDSPLYYVLSPLYGEDKGNIVRVPVDNPSSLRELIDEKTAKKLIKKWPSNKEDVYIVDSKRRKQCYEEALASGDLSLLAPLVCGAKQRKAKDGHLNSMDAQFVYRAEPLVLGELSICLNMNYNEVATYLASL